MSANRPAAFGLYTRNEVINVVSKCSPHSFVYLRVRFGRCSEIVKKLGCLRFESSRRRRFVYPIRRKKETFYRCIRGRSVLTTRHNNVQDARARDGRARDSLRPRPPPHSPSVFRSLSLSFSPANELTEIYRIRTGVELRALVPSPRIIYTQQRTERSISADRFR